MSWKLRFVAGLILGGLILGLSAAIVQAEVRQVGGNSSIWDKACAKTTRCMPVGDLGGGNKGYIVTNDDGSDTSVYCNKKKCVGEDGPAPAREAPNPPKHIADALAGLNQLDATAGGGQANAASGPDPLKVIQDD